MKPLEFGIMQGRLIPPYDGRFQCFPASQWREEFVRARGLGLDCIEWVHDLAYESESPFLTDEGLEQLRQTMAQSGVRVRSMTADYYMARPLVTDAEGVNPEIVKHLHWLIGRVQKLGGVKYIMLPFVDASSVKTEAGRQALIGLLRELSPIARKAGLEIHLETDFPTEIFAAMFEAVGQDNIRWCYDIGDRASLGCDTREELRQIGPWLGSVHVKDRPLGGKTIPLGQGNADFEIAFSLIMKSGFDGFFILQVARGAEGEEVPWTAANLVWIKDKLAAVA
jgi:L-ribulose-5-phosphate 3-epimerase